MDWELEQAQGCAFLREQLEQNEHKISRLERALAACDDCLEADGLRRMLHTAELEREVLHDLLRWQASENALSLDALLMQRARHFEREVKRLSQGWHRGRRTPAAYWDAESQRAFVCGLLRRYHARHAGRPLYDDCAGSSRNGSARNGAARPAPARPLPNPVQFGPVHQHPWYIPGPSSSNGHQPTEEQPDRFDELTLEEIDALHQDILAALETTTSLVDHLEIIVQPEGMVLLTGYVHDDHASHDDLDADAIVQAIYAVEGVTEIVADLKTVAPDRCPICHPPEETPAAPSATTDNV
ncbi:MAG: BON domain-containing protein [Chloroflexi bacterium]|nr:BON domain-containing protein [Chloroflexota bacterium]